MSILGIGGSSEKSWNYSDPTKPGFMLQITGTLVEINEVQSLNYSTRQPEYWPDGKPKLNIEMVVQGQSGRELSWFYGPKSSGAEAVEKAIKAILPNAKLLAELGGMMVRVTTAPEPLNPNTGQPIKYGQGNPRPWNFEILGPGSIEFRGAKEFQARPQIKPAPQMQEFDQYVAQVPAQMQPQYQQQQVPAPAQVPVQPQYQQQPAAQPAPYQQQPVQPAPVQQPVYAQDDIPF
jgi:hypothetical protein